MPNSAPRPITFFTPFAISHYRFQWIADLLLSCAMEMEVPILGWYILVETKSVMMLALFGGAQYIGTLLTLITLVWRKQIWDLAAEANQR